MSSNFRKFFKESTLYLGGLVLNRLVSFLLLPIYTNVFDKTQNGIITIAYAFLGFMVIILPYGTDAALLNFYTGNDRERKNYFSSAYLLVLISNLLILGLAFLARN
ncbi:MAG TPA: oligosaccharide flippase family protein, partial [Candidatus Marinimicrobia bacterium]|nr:oligosaccharide flippase family protein [Candidatus Neomarinimicrobiota bacterium]